MTLTVSDEHLDVTLQLLVLGFSVHHVPREGFRRARHHEKRERRIDGRH